MAVCPQSIGMKISVNSQANFFCFTVGRVQSDSATICLPQQQSNQELWLQQVEILRLGVILNAEV